MTPAGPRRVGPTDGRPGRGRTRSWTSRHPFLSLGLCSIPVFALLVLFEPPEGSPLLLALVALWQTLGFGPHAASNILAWAAPDLPAWLDLGLVVLLGAVPYLVADRLLRAIRAARRAGRADGGASACGILTERPPEYVSRAAPGEPHH
jgi:hypothetical protein